MGLPGGNGVTVEPRLSRTRFRVLGNHGIEKWWAFLLPMDSIETMTDNIQGNISNNGYRMGVTGSFERAGNVKWGHDNRMTVQRITRVTIGTKEIHLPIYARQSSFKTP